MNANFQDIEESRQSRRLNAAALKSQIEQVRIFGVVANLRKSIGSHELDYGMDYSYNDVKSVATFKNLSTQSTSAADTRYPDGGSNMGYLGIYLAHRWQISDRWSVSDGLRFSRVSLNARFEDKTFFPFPFSNAENRYAALNFSIGTTYKLTKGLKVYGSFNTGFRAPNVDDLDGRFLTQKLVLYYWYQILI